jgi:hypothetical protein
MPRINKPYSDISKMKVAILYICTGRYNQFFKGFYESCEKYFLKDIAEVEYFVFTDDMALSNSRKVHLHKKECKGFPADSLFRFDMFISIKEELKEFDYLFFFNANMLFVAPVGVEFLPKRQGIAAVIHPGFYKKPSFLLPYDRNKRSTAYIPPFKSKYKYYMGSLNGGTYETYMNLVEECSKNTHYDYDAGYVALVHDESHLNKYLFEHECLGLSPAYAYPEGWSLPFSPKIIIRDKVKIDPYFNKGRDHSLKGKLKKAVDIVYRAVKWYM